MIRIFPNKIDPRDPEVYATPEKVTLFQWLRDRGLREDADLSSMPVSVWHGEERILPAQWKTFELGPDVEIDVYREPKGTDPFSITLALIVGAKAVLSALMPKLPSLSSNGQGSGKALDEASAKGNKVKINSVIPELAGYNHRYPDYLSVPRRYFQSPTAQWLEMLLCVGQGDYDAPLSRVKIGETPLLSLGDDARFRIYPPGADMSAEPARLTWYQVPEVGSSSTGASGLELTVSSTLTYSATATAYTFNSQTVGVPSGAGSFPADWVAGLILNIYAPYAYTVNDGTGTSGRDVIQGDITQLGLVAGDVIEIQGDNAGTYAVFSATATELQLDYSGGAPAVGLVPGARRMAISLLGSKFRIISVSSTLLTVERLRANGSTDTTWPGWSSTSANDARIVLDATNLEGGYRGAFVACPENETVTALEYTVLYPGGIIRFNSNGSPEVMYVTHIFEYRDTNGGAWTAAQQVNSGFSLDAVGFTYRVNLPYPMRPECRMRRTPSLVADANKKSDKVMWYSLYSLMPQYSKSSYEGATTIAVYVRGSDRISSQTEALINLECTRKLPTLNGGGRWGPPVPTRQISAWIRYIALKLGYSDADLDIAELQRLELIWSARGDWYDRIITEQSTAKACMIEALQAGFAELTISRGLIRPVRDAPRGPAFDHMYNPMNMREALSREFVLPSIDDFDGVDVEYLDSVTWAKETVQCRLPGDIGARVQKMSLDGVTNRDRAWRIGMRQRRALKWRTKNYTFQTELDALNSEYLSYAALGDAVTGYGQSAWMKRFVKVGTTYQITTSEKYEWEGGAPYLIAIRRKDGSVSGPYEATRVSDDVLSISAAEFDADPKGFYPDLSGVYEPPFLQFGPASNWCYPALITEISPSGTRYCKVTAVNYDPRIYLSDNGFADN